MAVTDLPIFGYYNRQRFTQYGSGDLANWSGIINEDTKKTQALYPAMGRQAVNNAGINFLIFAQEPSQIFKTINYWYAIVGTSVIQVDKNYNQVVIGNVPLGSENWFSFLAYGNLVYAILTAFVSDGNPNNEMFVITENFDASLTTFQPITDSHAPRNPRFVTTFANFFNVSDANTPNYYVSVLGLGGNAFDPNAAFTTNGASLVARASGIIRQMCTLHNQMYIFNDFTTDIWANIPTQIPSGVAGIFTEFPFKLNSSYNWDYGLYDPFSLDVDFGKMAWLAKNAAGLVTFMVSDGQQPVPLSTQAINVLIQNSSDDIPRSNYLNGPVDGFFYQYENTVFYRASCGPYSGTQLLDFDYVANSIEFNFSTGKWARCIELNGERCRIQKHIFFNNQHLVTVLGDPAVYQMAGNIYHNENINPLATNQQANNAFLKYPMRYIATTQQIYLPDYAEFITDYVEIDFVFGNKTFYKNATVSGDTIFIITEDAAPDGTPVFCVTEDPAPDGSPVFMITEDQPNGGGLGFGDNFYNALFKPNVTLYYSDDGGMTYVCADLREFSPLGEYRWRMRWNELGTSRNRVYRLVCVSSAPIVVLGAVMDTRRASGGAN